MTDPPQARFQGEKPLTVLDIPNRLRRCLHGGHDLSNRRRDQDQQHNRDEREKHNDDDEYASCPTSTSSLKRLHRGI